MTQQLNDFGSRPDWIQKTDTYANKRLLSPRSSPGALLTPSISEALQHALDASDVAGLPTISVGPAQGRFLQLLLLTQVLSQRNGIASSEGAGSKAAEQPFHVLEVGTLGGYSTIWLAAADPSVRVVTIEYDKHHAEVARKNIAHAGLSDRVEVIQGDGIAVLQRLEKEVMAGSRPKIDFSFIDADKEHNWDYFRSSYHLARVGTVIVVDNVARDGRLIDETVVGEDGLGAKVPGDLTPQEEQAFLYRRDAAMGARTVVNEVGKDDAFEAGVVQWTEGVKGGWDGFLMGVVVK
ncbi:MAG: hypothetical protein M1831_003966 [Alyxoria varia]|nr:MAG: hypothetical protein M1831_003966 [Alyxoria varia]